MHKLIKQKEAAAFGADQGTKQQTSTLQIEKRSCNSYVVENLFCSSNGFCIEMRQPLLHILKNSDK